MEDSLQRVFSIIIAVIIFFLLPLYIAFEKKDDISYSLALKITTNFANDVKNKGYLTLDMYNKFINDLAVSDNAYDITLEHVAKKYNPVIYSYTDDTYKEIAATFDYNLYKNQYQNDKVIKDSYGNTYGNLVLAYELSEESTKLFLNTNPDDEIIRIESNKIEKIIYSLKEKTEKYTPECKEIILIAPMKIRHLIYLVLSKIMPNLRVVAREELLFEYPLQIISTI